MSRRVFFWLFLNLVILSYIETWNLKEFLIRLKGKSELQAGCLEVSLYARIYSQMRLYILTFSIPPALSSTRVYSLSL